MSDIAVAVAGSYILGAGLLGFAVVFAVLCGRKPPGWRELPRLVSWAAFSVLFAAYLSRVA